MSLVEPGKYVAKLSGPVEGSKSGIVVYETQRGALCAAVPCKISEGPETGKELKSTQTVIKQDGTVQTRTVDNLKAIFGWDGLDPFWLMDSELAEIAFQIVVENEAGQNQDGSIKKDAQGNTTYFSKVQWLNPLGGSMKMPEAADRRSVLTKYGSKFRALAGGALAKGPATKPSPAAPPVAPPPPTGPTATMEEAWQAMCKANEGKPESELTQLWFATLREKFRTDNNSQITPQQWGQLVKDLDNIPY
jgi:hypothetical protein